MFTFQLSDANAQILCLLRDRKKVRKTNRNCVGKFVGHAEHNIQKY